MGVANLLKFPGSLRAGVHFFEQDQDV
jgi:hypothetical protein